MRHATRILLLSGIILIPFALLVLFTCPVMADNNVSNPEINQVQFWNNNAGLSGANLQFSIPDLTANGVHCDIGARNLVSFRSTGSVPDGQYTRMTADAVFSVSAVFYSELSAADAASGSQSSQSQVYCHLIYGGSYTNTWMWNTPIDYNDYWTQYDSITVSSKGHGFDGIIKPTVSIADLTPESLNFGSVQYTIQNKGFIATVDKCAITGSTITNFLTYADNWNSAWAINQVSTTMTSDSAPAKIGDASAANNIQSLGLGVSPGSTTTPTLQQGKAVVSATGADQVNVNGFTLALVPNVYKATQSFTITSDDQVFIDSVHDLWDTNYGSGLVSVGTHPTRQIPMSRDLGWHVDNMAIAITFQIEASVYALIAVTPKTTTSSMSTTPNGSLSNNTWSNTGGQEGGTVPEGNSPLVDWLNAYGWIIVVVVIVVITAAILIYTPAGPALAKSLTKKVAEHRYQGSK